MSNGDSFEAGRRELIKNGEGCISHMYLDTVGKVTVGVGNMLPTADAATALPFIQTGSGNNATDNEIRADYNNVAAQASGKLAACLIQLIARSLQTLLCNSCLY